MKIKRKRVYKNLKLAKTHDFCAEDDPKLTVVFVHGIAADSSSFNGLLKHLERLVALRGVRFVTFDLLGSGKSSKSRNLNYDYKEQITALHNSIKALKVRTPMVLVGHSLGTFIVTRYAYLYKRRVKKLVLISPPIYTERDLDDPAFETGMNLFKDAVSLKNREILKEKAFNNSIEKIILNKKNYKRLVGLRIPTVLIYGKFDKIIASYNLPRALRKNSKFLTAIKTNGGHGVSHEKYSAVLKELEKALNAKTI